MNKTRQAFDQGFATALDPVNHQAIEDGQAVTTLSSYWLHQPCSCCGHTFRPGDEVCIQGSDVCHDSTSLACTSRTTDGMAKGPCDTIQGFFKGLDQTWPPPQNLNVTRIKPGHPLLAPAHAGFSRCSCAVCGHTIRAFDLVVICPCQPNDPLCQLALHRDPIHGLHCWDNWNSWRTDGQRYCLATSRPIK